MGYSYVYRPLMKSYETRNVIIMWSKEQIYGEYVYSLLAIFEQKERKYSQGGG